MRYTVVSVYTGRKRIHFIVDELINRRVGMEYTNKRKAETVCKLLNIEIEKTNTNKEEHIDNDR